MRVACIPPSVRCRTLVVIINQRQLPLTRIVCCRPWRRLSELRGAGAVVAAVVARAYLVACPLLLLGVVLSLPQDYAQRYCVSKALLLVGRAAADGSLPSSGMRALLCAADDSRKRAGEVRPHPPTSRQQQQGIPRPSPTRHRHACFITVQKGRQEHAIRGFFHDLI